MSYASAHTYTAGEIPLAALFAVVLQLSFFGLLAWAGANAARIKAHEDRLKKEVPIAVKPVLDPLPLLKLGGKKVKPKLPEMWKKKPPIPVKRFKELSAPSEKAKDSPEAIPTSKVAERDAEAPPPDAELAKEAPDLLSDAAPDSEPEVEGEGSPDGVEEGTETDPLKARAVNLYIRKITSWFNVRFRPPTGEIACEELKTLSAGVTAHVGSDRTVTGFSITSPSGNPIFDAKVNATMQGTIGQQLPPPPPLYPDILQSSVFPRLSGAKAKCDSE